MSPRTLQIRLALMAIGAILAGALVGIAAPEANATPLTYLQALNDNGLDVTNTANALVTGYRICEALDYANGLQVAQELVRSTDVPDVNAAAVMVVVAVEELCPWHDRRGAA